QVTRCPPATTDVRSCAASGQEAPDRDRTVVDKVPDERVTDLIGLLDHRSVRYLEPLTVDHHAVSTVGHVPFDLLGPESVCRCAAAAPAVVGESFHPPFDVGRNLCVLTIVSCMCCSRRQHHQDRDSKCSCEHRDLSDVSSMPGNRGSCPLRIA